MAKIKKRKQAAQGGRIKTRDSQAQDIDHEKEPPCFSLKYLCRKYCLSKCPNTEKVRFIDTLHRLSQKPWGELRNAPRHGCGFEKIDRKAINAGIPGHLSEDIDLLAFRYHGKHPMVGYRDPDYRSLFHVLWIDRDMTLYDHGS